MGQMDSNNYCTGVFSVILWSVGILAFLWEMIDLSQ